MYGEDSCTADGDSCMAKVIHRVTEKGLTNAGTNEYPYWKNQFQVDS